MAKNKRYEFAFTRRNGERLDGGLLPKSQWNELIRESLRAVGEYWHKEMRPKHFRVSAFAEYGYARRSNKYWKQKRKVNPGETRRPLVWTGESERGSISKRITARTTKVIITMNNVKKLNYSTKGGRIKMARELTTVTPKEIDELMGVAEKKLQQLANAAIRRL